MEISDKKLESLLINANMLDAGSIEQAKLEIAKYAQEAPSLQRVILDMGFLTEDAMIKLRATELGVPYLDIDTVSPEPATVTIIPEEVCVDKGVIALAQKENTLGVAMQDPNDLVTLEYLEKISKCKIVASMASRGSILRKLGEYHDHYKIKVVEKLLAGVQDQGAQLTRSMGLEIQNLDQVTEQAPIIKTVNLIILGALLKRASDIHLLPDHKYMRVKYRVDGVLMETQVLPSNLGPAVVSRIKIMSRLDIAEKRMPQDGSFHLKIEGRELDFRVAIAPTVCGEKVVIRVLDKSAMVLGLDHLGFGGNVLRDFKQTIRKPNGIVLIVGPTGSGKTTTLYSALNILNTGKKNITTVEDPVEYEIEGLSQIQVHAEIGLNFASVLRSILRQDPDVILVGEIRDLETTEIAIRAALTGHLVFATLHTNDAAGAVTRLTEMGAEPYLIASSLRCAMSQRLVRVICTKCKESYEPSPEALKILSRHDRKLPEKVLLYRGKGCRQCFHTGYRGRSVVAELLLMDENLRQHVIKREQSAEIFKAATAGGMTNMFEDGIQKVLRGVTTLEEVMEVTEDSE